MSTQSSYGKTTPEQAAEKALDQAAKERVFLETTATHVVFNKKQPSGFLLGLCREGSSVLRWRIKNHRLSESYRNFVESCGMRVPDEPGLPGSERPKPEPPVAVADPPEEAAAPETPVPEKSDDTTQPIVFTIQAKRVPYSQIPKSLFELPAAYDLTQSASHLIFQLANLVYGWHGESWKGEIRDLAKLCNCTRRTIYNGIKELEAKNVVKVHRRRDDQGRFVPTIVELLHP